MIRVTENQAVTLSGKKGKMTMKNVNLKKLVGLAVLTAIVFVLQMYLGSIKLFIFSFSMVLVPIVVGAALYGPFAGLWLGAVFGLAVLLSGDAAPFLAASIPGTVITVLIKGMGAGFFSGLVYSVLMKAKRKPELSVILSAVTAPIANTGLFLIGCAVFFMPVIREWAEASGYGTNVFGYVILGLVGVNFLVELAVNVILAPVILRIIRIVKKH